MRSEVILQLEFYSN